MLPFLKPGKKSEGFVVVEVGLERITASAFSRVPATHFLNSGRNVLAHNPNSSLEAINTLAATVNELPSEVVLGIADCSELRTETNRLIRHESDKEISRNELEKALEKLSPEKFEGKELYFSSLLSVKVDNNPSPNPIGMKGSLLEFEVLSAYHNKEDLDSFQKVFLGRDLELQKILPTAHALANYARNKGENNLIILRLAENKTQVIFIKNSVPAQVSFDLGIQDFDLWVMALKTTLEEYSEPLPTLIWVFNEIDQGLAENLVVSLGEFQWEKELGIKPEIVKIEVDSSLGRDPSLVAIAAM